MTDINRASERDQGFGLIEVVISMLVLAVLAIAFLPVLVTGLQQSAKNATLATATQLVNERMELVQTSGVDCANIGLFAVESTFVDQQGVSIRLTTTVGTCPDATGTVLVSTLATDDATGRVIAEASTRVLIT
jgi:prepilin-type N-terminal cleavage/methylation domain-containing protein